MTGRGGPVKRRALFLAAAGLMLFTTFCWEAGRHSRERQEPATTALQSPSTIEPAAAQPNGGQVVPSAVAVRHEPPAIRRATGNRAGNRDGRQKRSGSGRAARSSGVAGRPAPLPMAAEAIGILPTPGQAMDSVAPLERYQEVLVQLQFGRVLARTIPAYRHDDAALLPLTEFFRLAEITFRTEADSAIVALLYPSGRRLRIVVGDTLIAGLEGSVVIGPDDLIERQGELYLATEPLGQLLGLSFLVDWS